jgi:threonine dehydratase
MTTPTHMLPTLPTIDDVRAAQQRLGALALRTPLLTHPALDARTGGRVLLKAENLQRVGAFKFRGAYNKISQVDAARAPSSASRPGGVVACSSGNHAQGVAAAATMCGLASLIVMPSDAPRLKIERTRAFGGEVHFYDRVSEDRDTIAARLADERGAVLVPPFDDPDVIAGQGTAGLEMMEQAAELGLLPDIVLVPCGGGGLIGGIGLAVKAARAAAQVYSVEPAGFDDMVRSLASGKRETNAKLSGSFCDSLLAPQPGRITFELARRTLAGGLVVTDAQVADAIRFAYHELKLVLEPGGAVALAAVLSGVIDVRGKTAACVLSGGNVDPAVFAAIITAPSGARGSA